MKLTTALLVIAASAASVSAQLSDLPECSNTCAITTLGSLSGTCSGALDYKCYCTSDKFIKGIYSCISTACSAADQQKTVTAAVGLCKAAGAPISQSIIDELRPSTTPTSGTPASSSSAAASSSSAAAQTSNAAAKMGTSGLGLGAVAAALLML